VQPGGVMQLHHEPGRGHHVTLPPAGRPLSRTEMSTAPPQTTSRTPGETSIRVAMAGSRCLRWADGVGQGVPSHLRLRRTRARRSFWCEVLGYVVPPPPEGFADWDDFNGSLPPEDRGSWFACIDPSSVGPRLFFQRVPDSTPTGFQNTPHAARGRPGGTGSAR
jgi:hypothetical protein